MSETAPAEEGETGREGSSAPRTIAVDGSAASGKSTIGRRLAAALGYPFLDTGVMYRAVTQAALSRGVDVHDAEALAGLAGSLEIEVSLPSPLVVREPHHEREGPLVGREPHHEREEPLVVREPHHEREEPLVGREPFGLGSRPAQDGPSSAADARQDEREGTEDEHAQSRIWLDGEDVTDRLREAEVEENVSLVSRVPGVREALVRKQRAIASGSERGIVMAGRDIGTVVLPEADLKVYLDASAGERARRRHAEFVRGGQDVSEEMVLRDLRRRDQIDSEREASPLKPASDAVVVVTDGLSEDEVLERVLELVGKGYLRR